MTISPPCYDSSTSELLGLLDEAIKLDKAEMGNIHYFDKESQSLKIISHRGFTKEYIDYFSEINRFDSTASSRAFNTGLTIVIGDVNIDKAYISHRTVAAAAGFRAVKSVPLCNTNNEMVGVLSTHFKKPVLNLDLRTTSKLSSRIAELLTEI